MSSIHLNVTETKAFSSTVSKKECKMNHKFNYNDKCLICLLLCNKCMLQYVGTNWINFVLDGITTT